MQNQNIMTEVSITKTTTPPNGEYEKREHRRREEERTKRDRYAAIWKLRRDTETYGGIFYNREAIMRERGGEVGEGRKRKERFY